MLADDVRALVLARRVGQALALDADDLVANVCAKIARLNAPREDGSYWPSAYDADRAGIPKYVNQITSGIIADMLAAERRHGARRVAAEAAEDIAAPEMDPELLPYDPETMPSDPEEREAMLDAIACLEVCGSLPSTKPLWRRALDQREAEQRAEQATLFGPGAMVTDASEEPATPRRQEPAKRETKALTQLTWC